MYFVLWGFLASIFLGTDLFFFNFLTVKSVLLSLCLLGKEIRKGVKNIKYWIFILASEDRFLSFSAKPSCNIGIIMSVSDSFSFCSSLFHVQYI